MKTLPILISFSFMLIQMANAQEFIPLWPEGKMPNSRGVRLKDSIVNERYYQVGKPGMYAFFPSKDDNCGAAVVIYPGGGYTHITYNLGGMQLAKWFNTMGISAFVVIYRMPGSPDLIEREKGPLQDAQRAVRIVRSRAAEWGIQKDKVGVMGASAGGHLAALVGTATRDESTLHDSMDSISVRPAFMLLVSPVIDLPDYAYIGSRKANSGEQPSPELARAYSPQYLVTAQTPPTFMVHAFDDKAVSPRHSLLLFQALLEHKVSASYHVFPQGGHAINVNNTPGSTSQWTTLVEMWMKEMGYIEFRKK